VAIDSDVCQILEWDTAFFGFRIGRVCANVLSQEQIEKIDGWCCQNGVRCLYLLADSGDMNTIRLAERNGSRLVDIRMTFACEISANRTIDTFSNRAAVIRHAMLDDVDLLISIAKESHHDSRFYCDGGFPLRLCDALYETWIKQSCEGYADAVFVAELNDLPVGYVSCHLDEGCHAGRIGLLGVSSLTRGNGIGRALVLGALNWFAEQEVQRVTVVTQGRNYASQRLYQRCGFWVHTVQLWYHKWYMSQG
jgi:dTDP-4-amino-4,6-dideoxy-D-galactose acyltransferase